MFVTITQTAIYGKDEDCESGFMLIHGRWRLLDDKEGNWNTGKFLQKRWSLF